MKKAFIQFAIMFVVLAGLFIGLSHVPWVRILKVEQAGNATEEKLGNLIWQSIQDNEEVVHDATATKTIDSLISHICKSNGFENNIKLHIVQKDEVNAFALPNNHMVIYTGLIEASDNESELAGVIGHEMAHMKKNHVMKKLVKEIGFSVLGSMAAGGKGAEISRQALKLLSSTAYDRSLEKEADISSVDYMVNAKIDPTGLANFLYRTAEEDTNTSNLLIWASTHPDSKERSQYLLDYIKTKKVTKEAVLSPEAWTALKDSLKTE